MSLLSKANGSLTGRAILYFGGNLALNFLSVIAAPIFVRLMTTAEYGNAAIFFTWTTLLSNVVGLRVDGTLQNAKSTFGEKALARYCSTCMCMSIAALLVAVGVSVLLVGPLSSITGLSAPYWLLAVVTSFFLACSNVRKAFLTATKRATGDLSISLVLAFMQIVVSLVFILIVFDDGFAARVVGYALPTICIGTGIFLLFLMKGKMLFNRKYCRFCLSLCLPLIFNGIAYLLINQCGRLIVNAEIGASAAGVYSFAYTCALPVGVVSSAMGSAWTPEYYELLDKGKTYEMLKLANQYMKNMSLIGSALMLISPEVLIVLGTEEYYEGIRMLPMIVLACYFQYLYTWPVNAKFYSRKTGSMAAATAVAAIANVVLCFVLVKYFGAIGAAGASMAAFFLLFVIQHVTAKRELADYPFSTYWYVKGLIPVCAAMLTVYFLLDFGLLRCCLAVALVVPVGISTVKKKSLF